jgi:DNA-binding MurR/RpiR family transcriptional regulator
MSINWGKATLRWRWGLRAVQRQDAVIVISFAPYSREALTVVEIAQRNVVSY